MCLLPIILVGKTGYDLMYMQTGWKHTWFKYSDYPTAFILIVAAEMTLGLFFAWGIGYLIRSSRKIERFKMQLHSLKNDI